MSWDPKRQQQFLILLGFVILVLSIVPVSYRGFLFIILNFRDNNSYEFFKRIFSLFSLIISTLVVVSGFWFGRRVDLSRNYRKYLDSLFIGWVSAEIFIAGLWLITKDDISKSVYQVSVVRGLSGYSFLAPLFSGITLGWIVKERPIIRTEWNRGVLRYVVIYQGVVLLRSLVSSYLSSTLLHSGRSVQAYGVYIWVSSLVLIPVNLWYLLKMFEIGKKVELDTEYGRVLFTLWVPRVVVIVITSVANMIVTQTTVVNWLIYLIEDIILSPIKVFRTPFALLCLGYIHSRYRFVENWKE